MNDSPEKLIRTAKLGAGTPNDSALVSAGKPRSAAYQNAIQLTHGIDVIGSKPSISAYAYAVIEADFRSYHRTNAAQRHSPYEHYRLVYRYGYDLGTDTRYRDADWSTVELAARPRWEQRNPGTWEQFKEMIQYAWDTARCVHGAGKKPQ